MRSLTPRSRALFVLVALALIVVLSVVVAACGDDDESGGTTDEGTPVPGGTYNFPIRSEPISIEPLNNQEVESNHVVHQCFQGLYKIQQDGDTAIAVPDLAEKTEMNDDATVFTFTIKKGITFAPPVNREVKAQDFVDSWTRNADAVNKSDVSYILTPIMGVDPGTSYLEQPGEFTGLKVIDDYTFEVTLRYPYPEFPQTLAHSITYVTPVEYIEKVGAKAFADKPVGTGQYMVEEWVHRQKITLVKNPSYWDKENAGYVDTINMPIIDEDTTVWLEFQKGTIDFSQVPTGQVKAAENMPQVKSGEWKAERYPSTSVYFIGISQWDGAALAGDDMLPVRQALNHAADRDAVCNVVAEGVPLASDSIVPITMPGFKAGLNPYPYDPDKAKEVVDEFVAGGGEVPEKIPFWFNTGAGHDKIAEALAAGWKANAGIEIALNGLETNSYWTQLSEGKAPGLFRMGWAADYPSIDNFLYLFTTEGGTYGSYTFYANPEVDKLYEQARGTIDETERFDLYNQAEELVLTDAPCVPLYTYRDFRVTNEKRIGGFNYNAYALVDMWKVWVKE